MVLTVYFFKSLFRMKENACEDTEREKGVEREKGKEIAKRIGNGTKFIWGGLTLMLAVYPLHRVFI